MTEPAAAEPPRHRPTPRLLAPPWAPAAAALAFLVTAVLSGLVWHSTRLPGLDAWVLHLLGAHSGDRQFRLATGVASGLRALVVGGIVATALVAWMALRRWSAVALAVLAPAATLAAEKLLKPLVARRAPGSTVFLYPSGHVAVATALALSLVLILRPAMARPRVKLLVGLSVGAPRAADGVGAPGRDGAPADRRRRRSVDRGGGDPGRRPPARPRSVRGGFLELHPHRLGKSGVQRADGKYRQGDHGRGDPEAVEGGDQDTEQDETADCTQDRRPRSSSRPLWPGYWWGTTRRRSRRSPGRTPRPRGWRGGTRRSRRPLSRCR